MAHKFGERLKVLRARDGLYQRHIEELIHVQPGTVSQYERGLREPSFNTVLFLAQYFNVSVDYLLGRTDDPTFRSTKEATSNDAVPSGEHRQTS
jgi:transcriptional regulator with XRE-family HTH domain